MAKREKKFYTLTQIARIERGYGREYASDNSAVQSASHEELILGNLEIIAEHFDDNREQERKLDEIFEACLELWPVWIKRFCAAVSYVTGEDRSIVDQRIDELFGDFDYAADAFSWVKNTLDYERCKFDRMHFWDRKASSFKFDSTTEGIDDISQLAREWWEKHQPALEAAFAYAGM